MSNSDNNIGLANIIDNNKDGVIDLKNSSCDKLTITLEDIMELHSQKNITICGIDIDKILFQDTIAKDGVENHWSAVCDTKQYKGIRECIYTNSGDTTFHIKVEQPII